MSNTDPRRYDIPMSRAVTPGEGWQFDVTVKTEVSPQTDPPTYEDETSFADYDEWAFYVFESIGTAGATAADRAAKAYFTLTEGSGITVGTVPDVTIVATAAQTANVPPGTTRAWELWAEVNSIPKRLRHGTIPVVH